MGATVGGGRRLSLRQATRIKDLARDGVGHARIAQTLGLGWRRVLAHMIEAGLQQQWLDGRRNRGVRAHPVSTKFTDQQLLALVEEQPPLSISEMARRLGVSKASVQSRLMRQLPEVWLRVRDRHQGGRPPIVLADEERWCTVPGCGEEVGIKCRRLCRRHYQQWLLARPQPPAPSDAGEPARCDLPGCDRPVYIRKRGLCRAHYNRWRRSCQPSRASWHGAPA